MSSLLSIALFFFSFIPLSLSLFLYFNLSSFNHSPSSFIFNLSLTDFYKEPLFLFLSLFLFVSHVPSDSCYFPPGISILLLSRSRFVSHLVFPPCLSRVICFLLAPTSRSPFPSFVLTLFPSSSTLLALCLPFSFLFSFIYPSNSRFLLYVSARPTFLPAADVSPDSLTLLKRTAL